MIKLAVAAVRVNREGAPANTRADSMSRCKMRNSPEDWKWCECFHPQRTRAYRWRWCIISSPMGLEQSPGHKKITVTL